MMVLRLSGGVSDRFREPMCAPRTIPVKRDLRQGFIPQNIRNHTMPDNTDSTEESLSDFGASASKRLGEEHRHRLIETDNSDA